MSDTVVVGKWGNSPGVRLPKAFCDQLHISIGDTVVMSYESDKIIITNSSDQYTLQARMKDWDGKRLKTEEYDWGVPVGKELW